MGNAEVPRIIPSPRNNIFLQTRAASYRVLLTFLYQFHPPGVISFSSMASFSGAVWCLVLLASLWVLNPPGIISFFQDYVEYCLPFLTLPSTRNHLSCLLCQDHVGGCWLPFYYSIHQDYLFSLTTCLHQDHWFVGCCWPPSDYSIKQESLSLQWCPKISKDHVWCRWCPSAYPSTRNHLSLLYGTFNTATITLGVVGLPLTIPSTRNLFFLLHDILNRVRMIFGNVFLLKSPSPRNHLLILYGHCNFLHPAGKFFLPYHSLSMVLNLETRIVSLSLELWQKP